MKINNELYQYINDAVLPQYSDDNSGHGIKHIEYVIRRSLEFSKLFDDINPDVVFTAAAYHDIAHNIDKKKHEILSAQVFVSDDKIKSFFSTDEITAIKEAIEDHRASADHTPRSVYGKILSSADRSTNVDEFLRRTHAYTLKHFPDSTEEEIIQRAITHTQEKYGTKGYAKNYLPDSEYECFIKEIHNLLDNYELFRQKYMSLIK